MKLQIFQVDAFTNKIFGGNPAAVVPLEKWLDDETLQNIAAENNLSETAFFVPKGDKFHLRWFTPVVEVELCGHATLATSHVLFNHLGYTKPQIVFESMSGDLTVTREGDLITLNFPSTPLREVIGSKVLYQALGIERCETHQSDDTLVVLESEEAVQNVKPNFSLLSEVDARGIIITAKSERENVDFVSRFFAPAVGINEDPVTGSAHTKLIPFWAKRLGKNILHAEQISKRLGKLTCEFKQDRVDISGKAKTFLEGSIFI